jgi:hypothetical protein
MIKLFPAKCRDRSCFAAAVCGQALSWSITTSCQKGQNTGLLFHFVFFHKQLQHPAWTHQTRFCEEVTVKFVENAGKVIKWWIFSSTARTKSSLTTDGRLLRGSSFTFLHHSLKCLTHHRTIESLMACSPYTSQSWQWMSGGFMFLAFKKQITQHMQLASWFSWTL